MSHGSLCQWLIPYIWVSIINYYYGCQKVGPNIFFFFLNEKWGLLWPYFTPGQGADLTQAPAVLAKSCRGSTPLRMPTNKMPTNNWLWRWLEPKPDKQGHKLLTTEPTNVLAVQTFAEYCNWHLMYLSIDAQYNFHVHTMEIRDNLHFCLPPKK